MKLFFIICFLTGNFLYAVNGKSKSNYVTPPVYNDLPRTKAGLKRFLLAECENNRMAARKLRQKQKLEQQQQAQCLKKQCVMGMTGYYTCLSLADKNPSDCGQLAAGCGESTVELCRDRYYALRYTQAVLGHSPGAISFCIRSIPSYVKISSARAHEFCHMIRNSLLHGHPTPADICRKMPRPPSNRGRSFSLKRCEGYFSYLSGPNACSTAGDAPSSIGTDRGSAYNCEMETSVMKAIKAGNILLSCGNSVECQAFLASSRNACSPLKDVIAKSLHDDANCKNGVESLHTYCDGKATQKLKVMLHQEAVFRKTNHLPSYKDGDRLLNFLPPFEKEKYYDKAQEHRYEKKLFSHHPSAPPPLPSSGSGDSGE